MSVRRSNGAAVLNRRSDHAVPPEPVLAAGDDLAGEIAALGDQGVDALRVGWARRFRGPAPPIQSADVLRRFFAWRLQADSLGDLDAKTLAALKRVRAALSKGKEPVPSSSPALRAGSVLVREWRGQDVPVSVRGGARNHRDAMVGTTVLRA
jgi:hypothetical protein